MIEHQQHGYLARPFDAEDLAAGIVWSIDAADGRRERLGASARQFAVSQLDINHQVHRTAALYDELLAANREHA
jgi:hypothetical protein